MQPVRARGIISVVTKTVVLCALVSCGSADFTNTLPGARTADSPPNDGSGDAAGGVMEKKPRPDKHLALSWDFPCNARNQDASISAKNEPKDNLDTLTLQGGHQFVWDIASYQSIQLDAHGDLCQSTQKPRDILIIIDVSGSMNDGVDIDDPLTANGCHRSQAIAKILQSLAPLGQNRFAAITFGTNIKSTTGNFHNSSAGFYNSLGVNPNQTLCAAIDGTNFGNAFRGAEAFLPNARRDADVEIYFISDGAPSEDNGLADATRMKVQGALVDGRIKTAKIYSLMIGANNGHMQNIASKRPDETPYYIEVSNFQDMATQLLELTSPGIKNFNLSYREGKEKKWLPLEVGESESQYTFAIDRIKFEPKKEKMKQLWMKLEYTDNQDIRYQTTGMIGKTTDSDNSIPWIQIPGKIEVEQAMLSKGDYLDYSPGNSNHASPEHDIDFAEHISAPSEANTHYLNSLMPGEWLRFPIDVPEDGLYDIAATVNTSDSVRLRGLRFEVNANVLVGHENQTSLNFMIGTNDWKDVQLKKVSLKRGRQFLDLVIETNGFFLDGFRIEQHKP